MDNSPFRPAQARYNRIVALCTIAIGELSAYTIIPQVPHLRRLGIQRGGRSSFCHILSFWFISGLLSHGSGLLKHLKNCFIADRILYSSWVSWGISCPSNWCFWFVHYWVLYKIFNNLLIAQIVCCSFGIFSVYRVCTEDSLWLKFLPKDLFRNFESTIRNI